MSAEPYAPLPQERRKISQLISTAATIIEPPPSRDAGQWADDCRILPPEAPEPGPWRTSRVPFWSPIYRAFSDPQYSEIIVVCGAQMGKTEGMFNIIGHRLDDGPYVPALYVGLPKSRLSQFQKIALTKCCDRHNRCGTKPKRGNGTAHLKSGLPVFDWGLPGQVQRQS